MLPASAIGLRMVAAANLVEVAALVGDTARATMLNALMGGQSLTATELAYCTRVSRSTKSGYLSKLVAARLFWRERSKSLNLSSCCEACDGFSDGDHDLPLQIRGL